MQTFLIEVPPDYFEERKYILNVMLGEFLGLDFKIQVSEYKKFRITTGNGKELIIADGLFATPKKSWLKKISLPKQPLNIWDAAQIGNELTLVSTKVPIIYGQIESKPKNQVVKITPNSIELSIDIFGSAFFMLTRYEEAVKPDRDEHDRFPATAAIAFQEGFLNRPIVNEYLEILWACMKSLWPGLNRKEREFRMIVSHDVDVPFEYAFTPFKSLIRECACDIVKKSNLFGAMRRFIGWNKVRGGDIESDPCNVFDMIMDISEVNNLKSTFYFLAGHSSEPTDGNYQINHPLISEILKKIHQRGHEIGLHGSYDTYKDPKKLKQEFECLKKTCSNEGIYQKIWGVRQHYLRWRTPFTFYNIDAVGLDYDSTLTFADMAGFRCGVCYDYPVFDLHIQQKLNLREQPLIVMECTVLDERYMNLSDNESSAALDTMMELKYKCRIFKGNFSLLWHNSRLIKKNEIELYSQLIS